MLSLYLYGELKYFEHSPMFLVLVHLYTRCDFLYRNSLVFSFFGLFRSIKDIVYCPLEFRFDEFVILLSLSLRYPYHLP